MTAKKPMTHTEFKRLAEAAYGTAGWKMIVKEKLKVSREMLWRYENNETPISEELAAKFRNLFMKEIVRRRDYLNEIIKNAA